MRIVFLAVMIAQVAMCGIGCAAEQPRVAVKLGNENRVTAHVQFRSGDCRGSTTLRTGNVDISERLPLPTTSTLEFDWQMEGRQGYSTVSIPVAELTPLLPDGELEIEIVVLDADRVKARAGRFIIPRAPDSFTAWRTYSARGAATAPTSRTTTQKSD